MNNHFVREGSRIRGIIIACILMIPTFGLPMWGIYEMFFEPHYWKNRWKLYRLLTKKKVKVSLIHTTQVFGNDISYYSIEIDGSRYNISIWDGEKMTLEKEESSNDNYIGLFIGSPVTSLINRKTIKMIQDASI